MEPGSIQPELKPSAPQVKPLEKPSVGEKAQENTKKEDQNEAASLQKENPKLVEEVAKKDNEESQEKADAITQTLRGLDQKLKIEKTVTDEIHNQAKLLKTVEVFCKGIRVLTENNYRAAATVLAMVDVTLLAQIANISPEAMSILNHSVATLGATMVAEGLHPVSGPVGHFLEERSIGKLLKGITEFPNDAVSVEGLASVLKGYDEPLSLEPVLAWIRQDEIEGENVDNRIHLLDQIYRQKITAQEQGQIIPELEKTAHEKDERVQLATTFMQAQITAQEKRRSTGAMLEKGVSHAADIGYGVLVMNGITEGIDNVIHNPIFNALAGAVDDALGPFVVSIAKSIKRSRRRE